eukprot:364108-Chlamydomonas_euryale.AAC.7
MTLKTSHHAFRISNPLRVRLPWLFDRGWRGLPWSYFSNVRAGRAAFAEFQAEMLRLLETVAESDAAAIDGFDPDVSAPGSAACTAQCSAQCSASCSAPHSAPCSSEDIGPQLARLMLSGQPCISLRAVACHLRPVCGAWVLNRRKPALAVELCRRTSSTCSHCCISKGRALSEAGILFVEGFETTGHTIGWTLFHIVSTPGVL